MFFTFKYVRKYNKIIIASIVFFLLDFLYHYYFQNDYLLFYLFIINTILCSYIIYNKLIINPKWIINYFIGYNKGKIGLIITDPSEEIDDEVALYHLFKQTQMGVQRFKEIFIVFANGAHNCKITSKQRMEYFKMMFPIFYEQEPKINSTRFTMITSDEINNYIENHFDVFLQIAPLCGLGTDFFKNNSFGTRIVMGDLDDPNNSINLKKSWKDNIDLDKEFNEQEEALKFCKVKFITTSLARQVPLTFDNTQRLPSKMKDIILEKSFKLFVGRVPSQSPYCENVTVNANYSTIMNYLGPEAEIRINSHKNSTSLETLCKHFVGKMKVCNNQEKMEYVLKCISTCVEIITQCKYIDSNFQYDSISDPNKAKSNFIDYISKNKCDMTPAYDLTAMLLFLRPDIKGKKFDESYCSFFKSNLVNY